jgi:WD40 repeat protein
VIRLIDVAEGRALMVSGSTGPPVHALAYSHDGAMLVTGDDGGRLAVHDAGLGSTALPGHLGAVLGVAFGGMILASAGADATVRLWDGFSSQPLAGHTEPVTAVAFDPAGSLLASAGLDSTIRLWNPATGAHLHTIDGHDGAVHALVFAPGGGTLASAGADGAVRLWNVAASA